MPLKSKVRQIAERGSVKFHKIGKIEFWLTPLNKIFILTPDERVITPTLSVTGVVFDDNTFEPSQEVIAWLEKTLKIQRTVRDQQALDDED